MILMILSISNIGYVTITDLNYVKIDIVNLVPTNESKEIIKQYEEL